MTKEQQECSGACATCPFLKDNFGKPNPEGYDPKKAAAEHGRQFYDWYSEKNLARIWNGGLKRGEVMICHATDPTATEYGGKPVAPGNERPCVGSLAIVLRHLKFLERVIQDNPTFKPSETMKLYRAAAGKYPMPREGMLSWMWMIGIGRTGTMGGLALPKSLAAKTVEACGVPWRDQIVNGE